MAAAVVEGELDGASGGAAVARTREVGRFVFVDGTRAAPGSTGAAEADGSGGGGGGGGSGCGREECVVVCKAGLAGGLADGLADDDCDVVVVRVVVVVAGKGNRGRPARS
ncbi:hypothetical protein SPI_05623 [Niveomyces insectorum RCEF 264]|uniref:Uncharacterized protein n=1 Tax=Niveomyces insectorum RCEF 264 TaxID=1081102 RepID=A0A167TDR4_9HYPO|nr:hypothetical protein SPI_05623 [Niveomyces insectorum RCEF 264]